jgi:hypothetical protein
VGSGIGAVDDPQAETGTDFGVGDATAENEMDDEQEAEECVDFTIVAPIAVDVDPIVRLAVDGGGTEADMRLAVDGGCGRDADARHVAGGGGLSEDDPDMNFGWGVL